MAALSERGSLDEGVSLDSAMGHGDVIQLRLTTFSLHDHIGQMIMRQMVVMTHLTTAGCMDPSGMLMETHLHTVDDVLCMEHRKHSMDMANGQMNDSPPHLECPVVKAAFTHETLIE